jgi:hypothetical protein
VLVARYALALVGAAFWVQTLLWTGAREPDPERLAGGAVP